MTDQQVNETIAACNSHAAKIADRHSVTSDVWLPWLTQAFPELCKVLEVCSGIGTILFSLRARSCDANLLKAPNIES